VVSRGRLIERLTVLAPSSPAPAAHVSLARDIARLTLKPLEKKPLALPGRGDCHWWPQALIDAETLAPGYGASVLRLLLFDPVRVYERRAPDGRRALSVLAAVETEQARLVLHAVPDVPVRSGRPVGYGAFLLGSVNLDDADVVRRFLATLAEELRPESMYHDPDGVSSSALFVGELSQQEEVGLRCDLWARGIHLKPYLGEPVRRQPVMRSRRSQAISLCSRQRDAAERSARSAVV
jgi:hypothetical protein